MKFISEKTVKGIVIDEIENVSSEDINNFFNDNGGESDGNAYIIPLHEIGAQADYSTWGRIVDIKEIEVDFFKVSY